MPSHSEPIHIVGAGLAGSECAFQLAERGYQVCLYEMRPQTLTPAHKTGSVGELVCSNSLGSQTDYSAPGQLKWEAEKLNSLILNTAHEHQVPAGMSLSVDRERFSQTLTKKIAQHPRIQLCHEVITHLHQIPRPAVIATGPLTHEDLAQDLSQHFGSDFLYFFDAIAPVIDADSINYDIAWRADRWNKSSSLSNQPDYLNCPLDKDQYHLLINEILNARKIEFKDFEKTPYFESCLPIEVMAERGKETLRFGPLSPQGLHYPEPSQKPYAVVQLRQENQEGSAFNMVGFQTKMAYPEQKRIFRMIPGLEEAEFLKLGSMHRNLYIHSPLMLTPQLSSKNDPSLFFAGQITGVEGYFESTCMGLLVALFIDQNLRQQIFLPPPRETALGSLHNALTASVSDEKRHFQPTNINFSLMPTPTHLPLKAQSPQKKKARREEKRERQIQLARESFDEWYQKLNITPL